MRKQIRITFLLSLICLLPLMSSCTAAPKIYTLKRAAVLHETLSSSDIPDYTGEPYAELEDNIPSFTDSDLTATSYEYYSNLDSLGRCGTVCASISTDTMPTQKRGKIGQIKPSGWQTAKYDFVDGGYLYNRCHLIGYQLTAENANEKNLITGTRYFNTEGMLPFENITADYIKETKNHVLYRVTPVYDGDNLVARGVQMEAMSVEDHGAGILFNVFVYNVQPGVRIDYATGKSRLDSSCSLQKASVKKISYVLNTNTKKFHKPSCPSIEHITEANRKNFMGTGIY